MAITVTRKRKGETIRYTDKGVTIERDGKLVEGTDEQPLTMDQWEKYRKDTTVRDNLARLEEFGATGYYDYDKGQYVVTDAQGNVHESKYFYGDDIWKPIRRAAGIPADPENWWYDREDAPLKKGTGSSDGSGGAGPVPDGGPGGSGGGSTTPQPTTPGGNVPAPQPSPNPPMQPEPPKPPRGYSTNPWWNEMRPGPGAPEIKPIELGGRSTPDDGEVDSIWEGRGETQDWWQDVVDKGGAGTGGMFGTLEGVPLPGFRTTNPNVFSPYGSPVSRMSDQKNYGGLPRSTGPWDTMGGYYRGVSPWSEPPPGYNPGFPYPGVEEFGITGGQEAPEAWPFTPVGPSPYPGAYGNEQDVGTGAPPGTTPGGGGGGGASPPPPPLPDLPDNPTFPIPSPPPGTVPAPQPNPNPTMPDAPIEYPDPGSTFPFPITPGDNVPAPQPTNPGGSTNPYPYDGTGGGASGGTKPGGPIMRPHADAQQQYLQAMYLNGMLLGDVT